MTPAVTTDDLPCGYMQLSRSGQLSHANRALRQLLGLGAGDDAPETFDSCLTPGARLYCELSVMPNLWLTGAMTEIYLTLEGAGGQVVGVLADARVSDCGTVTHWCLHTMSQREKLETELVLAKRQAEAAVAEQRQSALELANALSELQRTHVELTESNWLLKKVATVIPTCMYCDRVKTNQPDQSGWEPASHYLARSKILVSHGCCPDCTEHLLTDFGMSAE
jgi:hypothetical protein